MVIILHNIRSLHNVGSIFRTADGVGAEKIYLTGYTPAPTDRLGKYLPQIHKVALGAEATVPWEKAANIPNLIRKLKKEEYKVFAVEQDKRSVPYSKLVACPLSHVVLIFGNEVRGLSRSVLDLVDKILEIPMYGEKESLNVSVSVGIVAYHLRAACDKGHVTRDKRNTKA